MFFKGCKKYNVITRKTLNLLSYKVILNISLLVLKILIKLCVIYQKIYAFFRIEILIKHII